MKRGAATTPGGPGVVVIAAGTSWDGIPMPEHHVAARLARRIPVLWVDPPISRLSPLKDPAASQSLREARLRPAAPGITRLTPLTVPGVSRPLLRRAAELQARRAVRRAVAELGARVQATLVASTIDLLDAVPARMRVFYGTDDFAAGARLTGTGRHWLEQGTERQLRKADLVLAISPALRQKWSRERGDIELLPNGCDAEGLARAATAPPPDDVILPRPIAGFVGHLSERIDLGLLERIAADGHSLLLVGPRQPSFQISRIGALLERPNVQWVGPKRFEQLPTYLGVIDVGLTPYAQSDFNRACFPLKTLEYLAAGRPAVVTDLPAHHWLGSEHLSIESTAEEFAEATAAALRAPRRVADELARKAFAASHSWAARADRVARLIGLESERAATPEGIA